MAQTVDPLAGSYYVESLTNEIEQRAKKYMATIAGFDPGGKYGMLRAIEQGYVQREIQTAAYAYQRAVDAKEAIVVGVNEFAAEQEVAVPIQTNRRVPGGAAGGTAYEHCGCGGMRVSTQRRCGAWKMRRGMAAI